MKKSSIYSTNDNDPTQYYNQNIIAGFVEEVCGDPTILKRLIDYKLLINLKKNKIQQQKIQILQRNKVLNQQYDNYQQLFGRKYLRRYRNIVQQQIEGSETDHIKCSKSNKKQQQYSEEILKTNIIHNNMMPSNIIQGKPKYQLICQQITKYQKQCLQTIQQCNKISILMKNNSDVRKNNLKIYQNKIKSTQEEHKKKQKQIYGNIQILKKDNEKVKQNIDKVNCKIIKCQQLKKKEGKIKEINVQKNARKAIFGELKQEQMEALKKYKNNMMHKNQSEKSMKKNSENKLNKIVTQLLECIAKQDFNKINSIAEQCGITLSYRLSNKRMISNGVRSKNQSIQTGADSQDNFNRNSRDQNQGDLTNITQQKELKKLQEQNPALRFSNSNLKQLPSLSQAQVKLRNSNNNKQLISQDKQQEFINAQRKLLQKQYELQKQENQLDGFAKQLKDKIKQKDQQLKDTTRAQFAIKRTLSSLAI